MLHKPVLGLLLALALSSCGSEELETPNLQDDAASTDSDETGDSTRPPDSAGDGVAWEVSSTFRVVCTREDLCVRDVTVRSGNQASVSDAYGEIDLGAALSDAMYDDWASIAATFSSDTCGRTQAIDVTDTLEVCVTYDGEVTCIEEASSCHGYGGDESAFVDVLRSTIATVSDVYDCGEWSAESPPFEPLQVDEATERFACF